MLQRPKAPGADLHVTYKNDHRRSPPRFVNVEYNPPRRSYGMALLARCGRLCMLNLNKPGT